MFNFLSVVQEVIEFFVMVFQFGVPQALFGVRSHAASHLVKEPGGPGMLCLMPTANFISNLLGTPPGTRAALALRTTPEVSLSQEVSSLLRGG